MGEKMACLSLALQWPRNVAAFSAARSLFVVLEHVDLPVHTCGQVLQPCRPPKFLPEV